MATIEGNLKQRHLDRKRKKYLWMKEHMPEALEMMKEGLTVGLTWEEPMRLRFVKTAENQKIKQAHDV